MDIIEEKLEEDQHATGVPPTDNDTNNIDQVQKNNLNLKVTIPLAPDTDVIPKPMEEKIISNINAGNTTVELGTGK